MASVLSVLFQTTHRKEGQGGYHSCYLYPYIPWLPGRGTSKEEHWPAFKPDQEASLSAGLSSLFSSLSFASHTPRDDPNARKGRSVIPFPGAAVVVWSQSASVESDTACTCSQAALRWIRPVEELGTLTAASSRAVEIPLAWKQQGQG